MKKFILALFLSTASLVCADSGYNSDYSFDQDRMMLAEDGIYLISSFEDSDKVTAYSYYGELLWDTSFHAKITSWQIAGNNVIVFSKHRSGYKTYITCLDRYSGRLLWQRP
jgi:outer membrane protein assembly factor BamB